MVRTWPRPQAIGAEDDEDEDDEAQYDDTGASSSKKGRGKGKKKLYDNDDEDEPRNKKKKKSNKRLVKKMRKLMAVVVEYQDADGRVLSEPFYKLPSRKELPDYYEIIRWGGVY
jgi:SWI/SNF-related matrix-associated actin-dependent regulator of chromatin subfamily A protein 2/4